ncbi:hypothetical protein ABB37_03285 [Leptomonas pyrrhocoris]|uniref:Uncharacterized protein n=1 Tax=Leptomonas pyrrhocoris TaxID=157538 RepID=A0A0N0DWT0_LEPPY|nr:hypothetical protein ABB37_03285 [Leptomonas pyrrhocoris]XP_015660591.1 hypothetical protein ABB37_03285 [Leptomonas pyrrhocoris]KPA82151.1 hypothetical protein ABB37_03285 [Leptomonas pyrrhocoris]KPA82152.1 hypothetical protein ABB37_03285 [Leptomonas pyrrhocoris]|eukprot:XP_015660590.1 hypothetical protein ABB37_03285 [Leptomonas pyrrhocoris]
MKLKTAMNPLISSSTLASPCVVGTLPPSLIAVVSQASHSVIAYLSAELPPADVGSAGTSMGSNAVDSTLPGAKKALRYAVFEDAATQRRWTVELSSNRDRNNSSLASEETESWSVDVDLSNGVQPPDTTSGASAASAAAAASGVGPLTGPKHVMQQDTWRETAMMKPPPPPLVARVPIAAAAADVVDATTLSTELQREGKESTKQGVTDINDDASSTSSALTAAGNNPSPASATPAVELPRPPHAPPPPITNGAVSSLHGHSLDDLKNQHGALLRLLVQVLAPQRMTTPLVVRKVCTRSPDGAASSLCEVHDPSSSSSVLRYTDADVATAVELLTTPHPRHPNQRELKSEAYLLMNLDGFADGELRHKAVNRAYPALALHWPTSAALLDAMERYVDREVVLETRKRHPKLTAQDGSGEQRKRRRSHSSSGSDSGSRDSSDNDERGAPATVGPSASSRPSSDDSHASVPPRQHTTQKTFQSLHEYPQSLERGDLHAWRDGAEATKVRECLQAATTLAQQTPSSSSASVAAASTSVDSATTLSVLPIANAEDVAVLRGQYDALATAEAAVERRLRDYRDTIQELKVWYRAEQCSPHFQSELGAWVQAQEEARAELVGLQEKVHIVRYKLERDLTDYLHLHALRVL